MWSELPLLWGPSTAITPLESTKNINKVLWYLGLSNKPWHVAFSAKKELPGGIFWIRGIRIIPGNKPGSRFTL